MKSSPTDTKFGEEDGGGGAPGAGAEIPLQPMEKTMVKQVASLDMEDYTGADVHATCTTEDYTAPVEDPMPGAVACAEEPTQEQVFSQDLWPLGDPRWSSLFLKDCNPWEGPMLEQFL